MCCKAQFILVLSFLFALYANTNSEPAPKLETVKQWSTLQFNFPWDWPVQDKTLNNVENIVATGIEISHDRIFISTPRLFSGVPATLSTLQRGVQGDSPVLNAYPDWSHHMAGTMQYNCSDLGLTSVYRMRMDTCNRLWALDSGISRSLEDYEVSCPPKILIYDLNTDQVVRRIDFPKEVVRGESLFTNMVIDETTSNPENGCDDVFIYITDTVAPGMVVYDSKADLTWRVSHPAMYPDPDFADSYILGQKFSLMDGIVGLAFDEEAGIIYFQPVATDRLFSITTKVLRSGPMPFGKELPVKLVGRKSSQGLGIGASPRGGTIFYSPFTETAIASWNPRTNEHKILAQDQEKIQFTADMTIPDTDSSALYVLTSKFYRNFLKTFDANEINTRILRIGGVATPNSPKFTQQPFGQTFPDSPKYDIKNQLLPTPFKPTLTAPNLPTAVSQGPKHYSYIQNYFPNLKQSYQYETNTKNNPFVALNAGENPHLPVHQRLQYGLTGEVYYPKINTNFNDFNGLRIPKSLNSTAITP